MVRLVCVLGTIGLALGCSSGGARPDAGTGGSGGLAGARGDGGSSPGDAGDAAAMDAPGFEVIVNPGTALCPTSGEISPGTATSPLPDGVEVVTPVGLVRAMVVSDTVAFWADRKTIHRVSLSDGSDTVVLDRSSANNSIIGLAIDGDTVYFGEAGIDQAFGVAKMPAAGGAPTTIVSGNSMWQVTVSGGFIYYYDAGLQEIGRAPIGGGMPTILVRDVIPSPLLVVGEHVYFVHPTTNSTTANVLRVPVTAQAPPSVSPDWVLLPTGAEVVAPGDHYASDGVAADQTTLYFDDDNRVMKVPLAGGTATMIYEAPDRSGDFGLPTTTRIINVLPANGKIYWSLDADRCSDIMWSNPDGSGIGSRVHGVLAPGALLANATHVYFIAFGTQLLRFPL